jgi:UDP-N-acetylglucosamine:LPS N-acetylglucosamine transferase
VTFAGSRGRFEAKLVPEAGFEFDAFEVTGLPRRPGVAQLRAAMKAAAALRASRRIQ